MHDQTHAWIDSTEAPGTRWLTELRPLDVCAFAGALLFVGYRFLCG